MAVVQEGQTRMLELLQPIVGIIIKIPIQDRVQLRIIQVADQIIIVIHDLLQIIIHTIEAILIAAQIQTITQPHLRIIPVLITVGLVAQAELTIQEVVVVEVEAITTPEVVEVEVILIQEAVVVEAVALVRAVVEEVVPAVAVLVGVQVVAHQVVAQEAVADNIEI